MSAPCLQILPPIAVKTVTTARCAHQVAGTLALVVRFKLLSARVEVAYTARGALQLAELFGPSAIRSRLDFPIWLYIDWQRFGNRRGG